jgi:hypothetical protein
MPNNRLNAAPVAIPEPAKTTILHDFDFCSPGNTPFSCPLPFSHCQKLLGPNHGSVTVGPHYSKRNHHTASPMNEVACVTKGLPVI